MNKYSHICCVWGIQLFKSNAYQLWSNFWSHNLLKLEISSFRCFFWVKLLGLCQKYLLSQLCFVTGLLATTAGIQNKTIQDPFKYSHKWNKQAKEKRFCWVYYLQVEKKLVKLLLSLGKKFNIFCLLINFSQKTRL